MSNSYLQMKFPFINIENKITICMFNDVHTYSLYTFTAYIHSFMFYQRMDTYIALCIFSVVIYIGILTRLLKTKLFIT